jgi:hypothetical protein
MNFIANIIKEKLKPIKEIKQMIFFSFFPNQLLRFCQFVEKNSFLKWLSALIFLAQRL